MTLTFADALQSAHLGAIFHGMQGEVDFGEGLLLLDGADGIVEVFGLIEALLVAIHGGRGL